MNLHAISINTHLKKFKEFIDNGLKRMQMLSEWREKHSKADTKLSEMKQFERGESQRTLEQQVEEEIKAKDNKNKHIDG